MNTNLALTFTIEIYFNDSFCLRYCVDCLINFIYAVAITILRWSGTGVKKFATRFVRSYSIIVFIREKYRSNL